MRRLTLWITLVALTVIGAVSAPTRPATAHAALVRSDPAAGAALDASPDAIQMWFAEPLEASYTGADLLDATGTPVAGVKTVIDPRDDKALVLTLPSDLPDGPYTVAWRTLSAADGHTLSGYFGFRIGSGTAAGFVPTAGPEGNETARALTRGLALIGLAMLLAIAPVTLIVLDPTARSLPGMAVNPGAYLRRYAVGAAVLAILTSVAALAAQAAATDTGQGLASAVGQTLTDTRYGQIWLFRLLGLIAESALVIAALWGRGDRRRGLLLGAAVLGIVVPLPFSLLSHAAAEPEGTAAAITSDVLHLFAASIWGGGVLLLAIVLAPALRSLPTATRQDALRLALPRFSIIGVATWAVLVVSGLYAAWLHVGTLEALRETTYGQTLILKGVLLLPVLALAAFHFVLGSRGMSHDVLRAARTIAIEALLVMAILLVVGRLIGQEPARTVLASQQPTQLEAPLSFATRDGTRQGELVVSPGAVGINTFRIEMTGDPLPDGSEGVLRFTAAAQDMGTGELRLPQSGPNQFSADGSELALAGEWQIDALVRKIGAYSWTTHTSLQIETVPPPAPELNPAPLFGPAGVFGMIALAIGLSGLVTAVLSRGAEVGRRGAVALIGAAALAAGIVLLAGSRLPGVAAEPVLAGTELATPAASPPAETGHSHATPGASPATPVVLPGIGTPVSQGGLVVTVEAPSLEAGSNEITIDVHDQDGTPVSGARVVLFAEMTGMGKAGNGIAAEEAAPGRYVARNVPLTMEGDWRVTVRISPKGQSTQSIPMALSVS